MQKCSKWVKIKYTTQTTWHQKNTHSHIRDRCSQFEPIDKIVVQGSKVFINFSGNEKSYEYTWKPANKTLLAYEYTEGFVKDPTSLSLGRFYNDSLKSGDLVQINQN